MKNSSNNNDIPVWGEFTKRSLLKTIYQKNKLENMSEDEVNRMLEDLI